MQKRRGLCPWLRATAVGLVVTAVLAAAAGCQRFDAAEPLWDAVKDQHQALTGSEGDLAAFLRWCVDEWKGTPDSWGP